MKITPLWMGSTEMGVEIKLADRRGRVVQRGTIRLAVPGGHIDLRLDDEKRLELCSSDGTLVIEPRVSNVVSVSIRDHFKKKTR